MAMELGNISVLVVDSSLHIRRLLKGILRGFGVREIRDASDGSAAFAELKVAPADLIITGYMMEPMDGVEFVRRLRGPSGHPARFVPIIMATAHTERSRVIAARDSGVTELLAKPISPLALYQRIESVVHNTRQFIQCDTYSGPCRRRRNALLEGQKDRRSDQQRNAA